MTLTVFLSPFPETLFRELCNFHLSYWGAEIGKTKRVGLRLLKEAD